ncbi:MAG: hypothetical protein MOB07_23320 [Acidobacteria bacterium]|nr:hypothetical protein [Acidobacteriota bacterium]
MNQAIIDALHQLDPNNDEHWTSKGLPQTSVVATLSGVLTLTRAELLDTAPYFNRTEARRLASDADEPQPAQPSPPLSETEPEALLTGASGSLAEDPFAPDIPTLAEARAMQRAALKESIDKELAEVTEQIGLLRRREHELIQERDRLIIEDTREEGPHANQKAIMSWIDGQNAQRQRRAERQQELVNKGVDPSELAGHRAPIDSSMARSSGFGHARPKYPQYKK